MSKTVCIYHGNCMDGFTAAWVMRKRWQDKAEADTKLYGATPEPEPIWIAGVYQRPVPLASLEGKDVYILDFSYKRADMLEILKVARSVVWIDHHKSAILDMVDVTAEHLETYLDLNRSGAGLAWDYFFPNDPRPQLVNLVEDRDLWKFAIPFSREINASLFSHVYNFETWDELEIACEDHNKNIDLVTEGVAIERKHFKDINELLPICTRHIRIAGHIVPAANMPYTMVSDAGNILAQRNPSLFGICYYDGMDGRNFSLRSVEGGMDVSLIAKQFGGGGHAKSAGFRVDFETARGFELEKGEQP